MIYKMFGKTGKMVSVIGMGGMRFKKEEYADGNLEKPAAIVLRAFEQGVNYFDTAPGYCDNTSERIYGEAFKTMKGKGTFHVSTKCGLWNAKNSSDTRRMIEKSLQTMGLEKLDFYNMWCAKTLEEYREFLKKDGIYEGALQAQREHLIDHICFTTHMSGEDIAKVANDGLYEGVTLGYNAVNFAYRQKGIEACHAAGLGVVIMNPLGGGIIPSNPDYFSFLKRGDDSLAVSALKFIISQDLATVAIPGYSSVAEVDENVKAAENLRPATKGYLEEMATHLTTELNALCTGCSYCDSCPVDIPIPKLLESYNNFILSKGNMTQVKNRLKNHWGIDGSLAATCTACGQCETLCTQKLPIIKRLAEIAAAY